MAKSNQSIQDFEVLLLRSAANRNREFSDQPVSVKLYAEQKAALDALSKRTGIPVMQLIRTGADIVIEQAKAMA